MEYTEQIQFIQEHIPSWASLSPSSFQFVNLVGGHSRPIFKVTNNQNVEPNPIVIRKLKEENVLGLGGNDNYFFGKLSSHHLGPQCYGYTTKYRVEEYVDSRLIKSQEIMKVPFFRRKLALQLSGIHNIKVDDENIIKNMEKNGKMTFTEKIMKNNWIITNFNDNCKNFVGKGGRYSFIDEIQYLLNDENTEFIKGLINQYEPVIAHNDIWIGNILVNNGVDHVFFIDYENFFYNFRGYDIGKLLLETVFDRPRAPSPYCEIVKENYPNDEEIRDFLNYYIIGEKMGALSRELEDRLVKDDAFALESRKKICENDEEWKTILDKYYREMVAGTIVSTYYCSLLGTALGERPSSELDFINFARDNFYYFKKFKEKLLN